MPGPHRTRADEIAHLRKRTPRYRVPFPNLKCEQRTSPCSNSFAKIVTRPAAAAHSDAACFPIGHNHKQAYEMVTPWMSNYTRAMSGNKT